MTNKKNWLGMLVLALVFGMVVVGNIEAQTDSRLNGTWEGSVQGIVGAPFIATYKFNNGKVEYFHNGSFVYSATYTTHDNNLGIHLPETEGISYVYSVSGNTLTLRSWIYMGDDAEAELSPPSTYTKKQEAGSSNRGGEPALIGRWVPEAGQQISSDYIQKRAEFKNDGTGIADGLSLTWTTEYGRLTVKLDKVGTYVYNYKITGSTLVLSSGGKSVRYKKE